MEKFAPYNQVITKEETDCFESVVCPHDDELKINLFVTYQNEEEAIVVSDYGIKGWIDEKPLLQNEAELNDQLKECVSQYFETFTSKEIIFE